MRFGDCYLALPHLGMVKKLNLILPLPRIFKLSFFSSSTFVLEDPSLSNVLHCNLDFTTSTTRSHGRSILRHCICTSTTIRRSLHPDPAHACLCFHSHLLPDRQTCALYCRQIYNNRPSTTVCVATTLLVAEDIILEER